MTRSAPVARSAVMQASAVKSTMRAGARDCVDMRAGSHSLIVGGHQWARTSWDRVVLYVCTINASRVTLRTHFGPDFRCGKRRSNVAMAGTTVRVSDDPGRR